MNFEHLPATPEIIELPPELAVIAKKGLRQAESARESLTNVTQAMAIQGMDDTDRKAYLEILDALARLQQDKNALKKHLN